MGVGSRTIPDVLSISKTTIQKWMCKDPLWENLRFKGWIVCLKFLHSPNCISTKRKLKFLPSTSLGEWCWQAACGPMSHFAHTCFRSKAFCNLTQYYLWLEMLCVLFLIKLRNKHPLTRMGATVHFFVIEFYFPYMYVSIIPHHTRHFCLIKYSCKTSSFLKFFHIETIHY